MHSLYCSDSLMASMAFMWQPRCPLCVCLCRCGGQCRAAVILSDDVLLSGASALIVLPLWEVAHKYHDDFYFLQAIYNQDSLLLQWSAALYLWAAVIINTAVCSSQNSYSQSAKQNMLLILFFFFFFWFTISASGVTLKMTAFLVLRSFPPFVV